VRTKMNRHDFHATSERFAAVWVGINPRHVELEGWSQRKIISAYLP
jgi:hypothetical protein